MRQRSKISSSASPKGCLIVFEGGEATGKSTQIEMLRKALEAHRYDVLVTREPGGTPLGEALRGLFKGQLMSAITELFMLEAARSHHVSEVIAPALKRGCIVISDRFAESSVVYQGMTRGLDLSLVKQLNRWAVQGVRADRLYLLDAQSSWTRMKTRGNLDRLERENKAFHTKIRLNYLKLARRDRRFRIIDADLDRKEIHDLIFTDLKKLLKRKFENV